LIGRSSRQPAVRALLAMGDAAERAAHARHLRACGYEINEADDGGEALAKALSRIFDVIVADIALAGINGSQLCALLRCDGQTQFTPIVIVAPRAGSADIDYVRQAGADLVLMEPVLSETLQAEICRLAAQDPSLPARARTLPSRADRAEPDGDHRTATGARPLSRAYLRHRTTTPPLLAPTLYCPQCDRRLTYSHSHIGGVSARHAEQWDYYECPSPCGTFQYRQRTRRLRKI
jgi:CheY-like chemotaxis protein